MVFLTTLHLDICFALSHHDWDTLVASTPALTSLKLVAQFQQLGWENDATRLSTEETTELADWLRSLGHWSQLTTLSLSDPTRWTMTRIPCFPVLVLAVFPRLQSLKTEVRTILSNLASPPDIDFPPNEFLSNLLNITEHRAIKTFDWYTSLGNITTIRFPHLEQLTCMGGSSSHCSSLSDLIIIAGTKLTLPMARHLLATSPLLRFISMALASPSSDADDAIICGVSSSHCFFFSHSIHRF